jgi:hypothetical protein
MKGPFKFIALALVMLVSLAGFSNTLDAAPDSLNNEVCLHQSTQLLPVIAVNVELHSIVTPNLELDTFDVESAVLDETFNFSYRTSFSEDTNITYFKEKCGKPVAYINYIYRPKV